MQVYLAARFDHRDKLKTYREELQNVGVGVTSRWLDKHGQGERDDSTNGHVVYTSEALAKCALEDVEDIKSCDVFVTFTEKPSVGYTSGGRHVEFGIALNTDKRIVIVGPRENVFHELAEIHPSIEQVATWEDAKMSLFRMAMFHLNEVTA